MERSFHDAQKEIANVFHRINKDLSTLNGRANRRAEGEVTLAKEVQKDRDQQWKLIQRLEALEAREQDREVRIALQEDQIQGLQREIDELQGKICRCHEQVVPSTQPVEEEEEGLEYASERSYVTPPTAPLELEDIIVQDALQISNPLEEQSGVRECCRTRVVEYMDDLVEIADDERSSSSSSESSSSPGTSLPGLEDLENVHPVPVPPPVGHPPPYAVSGQRTVRSQGIPKSSFHPYPFDRRPLGPLRCSKTSARRLHDGDPSWRAASSSSSTSSRGYGVVYGGSIGQGERGSSGGRGSGSSPSSGGGDLGSAREESSDSSVDPSSRAQERNLRRRLVIWK